MYAKPQFRALDAAIAQASCTPCDSRGGDRYTIYVSADYSQAYGTGFCSPVVTGTPGVGINIGQYVAKAGDIAIHTRGGDGAAIALLP